MSGWENSAITIATLLPLVGALVIALVPAGTRWCVRGSASCSRVRRSPSRVAITFTFDYGRIGPAVPARHAAGSPRSTRATTWGSTASACRCSC